MLRNSFQYGVVALTLAAIISHSAGRDLRPSEHGLDNQRNASPPTHQNGGEQQLLSFFGSTTPYAPLPEAQSTISSGGPWWSLRGDGGSRDRRRDHVIWWLLAAATICGFAGVVLLLVSGVAYLRRRRKEMAGAARFSSHPELHDK